MTDTLQLIEQLIEEHKVLAEKTQSLEAAVNDARLLTEITKAKNTFVPGRHDQADKLKIMEEMLQSIDIWLDKHFIREETILLKAVEEHGDVKMVESLNKLLFEHSDLRFRIAHSKKRVAELLSGDLQRFIWDASANDARTYLSHTHTLLATHAAVENGLFTMIRKKIKQSVR